MIPSSFSLALTPHGHLHIEAAEEPTAMVKEQVSKAFDRGSGHGLLLLGVEESGSKLSPVAAYWRDLGVRYVAAVCSRSNASAPVAPLPDEELTRLALAAPPMTGGEYLTTSVLQALWQQLDGAFATELAEAKSDVQAFLKSRNPGWNLVGRVHFNLAENRKDPEAPFAFLATYTTHLSGQNRVQHLPLGEALREYAGAANHDRLLSLLTPVQRASENCAWLKQMVGEREIYHPLRWTPREALQLLQDVPQLESAGVVVRMPANWHGNRPPRPRVTASVGGKPPTGVGKDALLDFQMAVTLDGEPLTADEISALLSKSAGLALVRGRWVEIDGERMQRTINRFKEIEQAAEENGLAFGEAMRLVAGVSAAEDPEKVDERSWAGVVAGTWLTDTLQGLRSPQGLAQVDPGDALKGSLRHYQQVGVRWLYLLTKLGLGACLADDMGLGKTIQVLSLLLVLKREEADRSAPSLLVAPASLLANWGSEIERFAPGLKALTVHPSSMSAKEIKELTAERLAKADLVITTYGTLLRVPQLAEMRWRLAILDEAQTIKNPAAKQTRVVKKLDAGARVALTGTPVENRLGDLWSIFDFVNPGLLGSAKEFSSLAKGLAARGSYEPLRELVRPYILRRLKTDKTVISDLPEKTELKAFCSLSKPQAALYQQAVTDLETQLREVEGIQRRGLVLSYLMRFKQICNHPSQWLGDQAWKEADSGKWARLRDIAEVIAARQEKMLVFTQFREVIAPVADFLHGIFKRPGVVLHGETEVKKRKDLVRSFQEDESVGFFVLSLKAGGSGLNLTAASHVVHFDRWWNPAVENQATDRAFRIGQTKNVLVHKFICRGTVEDKIDELIESKMQLSADLLAEGAGLLLTEMKDDELLKLVSLDLNKALAEA